MVLGVYTFTKNIYNKFVVSEKFFLQFIISDNQMNKKM